MLRSRQQGMAKGEDSICIEPTDKRSAFPSAKPVDTMNFPYKFITLTAIAFSIVLLLLSGHSRAAPAIPHQKCTSDYECDRGEFCRQNFGASYCAPCLECNRYNREPSTGCARSRTDCGLRLTGFRELRPHCSRLVKENVTSNATDQTPKHEPGAQVDQSQVSFLWCLVYVAAISPIVVIVMAISFGYYIAVPEGGGVANVHNNNAPPANDNHGDPELLLEFLENEIEQAFVSSPEGQVTNGINNENELNEEPMDLEQFAGDDNDPTPMDENHDDQDIDINDNNDHHMDENNVQNAPQGPLEEPEFELSDHIVPDFPSMENSAQNTPPQDPQQLAQVMLEVYGVVMVNYAEEENVPQQGNQ